MVEERNKGIELAEQGKYEEAIELLNIAIDKGSIKAINDLGVVYELMKDYEKSVKCYEKASILGIGHGTYNLGLDYEKGRGVEVDLDYSKKLFEIAVKQGCCHANYAVALAISKSHDEKNYKRAFKLAKDGIELDDDYLENPCMWLLGTYYEEGIGTKINKKKALKCYLKCAYSGDYYAMYRAAFILYKKKHLRKKEINLMLNLLEEAIEKGHKDAPVLMATIFNEGKFVEKKYKIAFHYLLIGLHRDSWYAVLTYIDFCLSGNYIDQKLDKEMAYKSALYFLVKCDNFQFYSKSYSYLRKKYVNSLEWEELERDAVLLKMNDRIKQTDASDIIEDLDK